MKLKQKTVICILICVAISFFVSIPIFYDIAISFSTPELSTLSYKSELLILNILASFFTLQLFYNIYKNFSISTFGVLLYLTCPYRFYICYDNQDIHFALAWTIIPLVLAGIFYEYSMAKKRMVCFNIIITICAFVTLAYSSFVLLIFTSIIYFIAIIYYKKPIGILPLFIGYIISVPTFIKYMKILFTSEIANLDFSICSITPYRYQFRNFLSSWTYSEHHPGFGLALLLAMFLFIWFLITEAPKIKEHKLLFFLYTMLTFILLSATTLWDVAQRIGTPFLRFISLMETPAFCMGFVSLFASILSTYAIMQSLKRKTSTIIYSLPCTIAASALLVFLHLQFNK